MSSSLTAFLLTPEEIEAADLFLRKAASDLVAAWLLAGDDAQDDDIVWVRARSLSPYDQGSPQRSSRSRSLPRSRR